LTLDNNQRVNATVPSTWAAQFSQCTNYCRVGDTLGKVPFRLSDYAQLRYSPTRVRPTCGQNLPIRIFTQRFGSRAFFQSVSRCSRKLRIGGAGGVPLSNHDLFPMRPAAHLLNLNAPALRNLTALQRILSIYLMFTPHFVHNHVAKMQE